MSYFVYIIKSEVDGTYYKGFSEDPQQRILQHNNGDSKYTSLKIPWQLIYVEELPTKRDALIREKVLKKYSHRQIDQLIVFGKNLVDRFR